MLALIELSLNIEFTNWMFADIHYLISCSVRIFHLRTMWTYKPKLVIRPHMGLSILCIHAFLPFFVFYWPLFVGFFAGIPSYVKKNPTKIHSI